MPEVATRLNLRRVAYRYFMNLRVITDTASTTTAMAATTMVSRVCQTWSLPRTLRIDMPKNTAARMMVNWNRVFSKPPPGADGRLGGAEETCARFFDLGQDDQHDDDGYENLDDVQVQQLTSSC